MMLCLPKGQQLTSRMTPCLLWSQPRTGSTCWTLLCLVSKHVSNFDPELWCCIYSIWWQFPGQLGQWLWGKGPLPPAKGPFGCMRCRAAPKRCANCREPTFEGLRFANRAQWQAWKDAKDCQKKWRANALPLLANFFGVRQPIVCQWGYTCPCQRSWKSYLILPANALLFVFNPQHFCVQPTSGLGRTRSIECWQAFAAQVQTNLPQGHQGEWGQADGHEAGATAMATLTNGTDHWHSTGQVHQWHWTSSSMWAHTHPASGHLLHSAPVTNHEEGATNAQCQRAQAPALLMKRCVSSMTRLPACLAIFGTAISHFVAIRFTCFVFFIRTHVFSWVDRSYATTKLFYIDFCVFVFLFDVWKNDVFNTCNIIYISATHNFVFWHQTSCKNSCFLIESLFQKKFFCVEEAIKFSIQPKRKFRVSTVITC